MHKQDHIGMILGSNMIIAGLWMTGWILFNLGVLSLIIYLIVIDVYPRRSGHSGV